MTTRKWSSRSLKNMRGIHPDLRRVLDRALAESPLDFIVIEGLRTRERQAQLVASGDSQIMNSRHLTGHAVDILPIGHDGKAAFAWPLYDRLGPAILDIADQEGVDLDWGGNWRTFKDGPHFELNRTTYPESEWSTGDKPPRAPSNIDDREGLTPAVGAGGAGAIAVALDALPAASGVLGSLAPVAQTIAVIVAALFISYLLWKRAR